MSKRELKRNLALENVIEMVKELKSKMGMYFMNRNNTQLLKTQLDPLTAINLHQLQTQLMNCSQKASVDRVSMPMLQEDGDANGKATENEMIEINLRDLAMACTQVMGIELTNLDNNFVDIDDDDPADMSNRELIVTINKNSVSQES